MTRLNTTRLKEDSQETGVEVEELSHHSSVPGTHIPLSFPPSNSGPYPGAEPASLASSALANRFLTTSVTWKASFSAATLQRIGLSWCFSASGDFAPPSSGNGTFGIVWVGHFQLLQLTRESCYPRLMGGGQGHCPACSRVYDHST